MADNNLEDQMQSMTFDPSLKKKKKSSSAVVKPTTAAAAEEQPPVLTATPETRVEEPAGAEVEEAAPPVFNPEAKKKKKVGIIAPPVAIISDDGVIIQQAINRVQPGISTEGQRDYTYEELLNRAFEIMRQKNPDIISGEKKRFIMKPPSVMRAGTRKTSFANFAEICRLLKRQPKHVLAFILAELGTEGSVDSNECLIIKGRFQQAHIETVLRKYIKEYVTCHTCRAPETHLQKEDRLYFLQCEVCQSRCSVAGIKTGFHAQVGKRAAQRAKTVS